MSQAEENMNSMCIDLFDDAMVVLLLTTEGLEWVFADSNLLLQMDLRWYQRAYEIHAVQQNCSLVILLQ